MSLLLLLTALAASWNGPDAIVETRTIRQNLPLAGSRGLTVDNLYGAITAIGDGGDDVRMVITERIEAEDRTQLELARQEVSLESSRQGDRILLCVDGPFRDPDDCTKWARGLHAKARYRVVYEFELRVPRTIDLTMQTVEGDLDVSQVRGRLEVGGVKGSVEIRDAVGPVQAGTVSGPLRVRFAENPREDSRFSNIDGTIDVGFQPDMSADLSFETMSGKVVTDFDYQVLQPLVRRAESKSAGTTYRLEVDSGIRIGHGGPHHRFTSISGDITIHRN